MVQILFCSVFFKAFLAVISYRKIRYNSKIHALLHYTHSRITNQVFTNTFIVKKKKKTAEFFLYSVCINMYVFQNMFGPPLAPPNFNTIYGLFPITHYGPLAPPQSYP